MDTVIEIIKYNEKYQPDFKRLNLDYLDKYNLTESHDMIILDNPGEIVLGNGRLFMAGKSRK